MANWWNRLVGRADVPAERKASSPQLLATITSLGDAEWSRRGFVSLVGQGYMRNPVVYRCVRMIAEAANRVPLLIEEGGHRLADHPLLDLLRRPNPRQSGSELLEELYVYLQTAGNAYVEAVLLEGEVRGLQCLRPDRVRPVVGRDGHATGYSYTAGGASRTLSVTQAPVAAIMHLALFHPLDDHFGMSPLEAALQSLDIHNSAAKWNKALLDNAARPSGALVYSAGGGNLTQDQFERLKSELEHGFSGAANAGRPMVLEGGLDWKTIALTPRDMDFIELKNSAAREIALALGVPPMLLGIPGDNTYANLAEANRSFWRQTIVPLVCRVADDLGWWLAPGFGGALQLVPEMDAIEALAEDQAAKWTRIGGAGFLSDAEKRRMLGVADA